MLPSPPTLCIQYETRFGIVTDPILHHTLHECQTAIGIRRRDFATPVSITVTDITTGIIMAQTSYKKESRFGDAFYFLLMLCFSEVITLIL